MWLDWRQQAESLLKEFAERGIFTGKSAQRVPRERQRAKGPLLTASADRTGEEYVLLSEMRAISLPGSYWQEAKMFSEQQGPS